MADNSNLTTRFTAPISTVSGGLVGDNLLSQLKSDMILQNVFKAMFGSNGERIFIDQVPSYNETIFPLIEFYWSQETYENDDNYLYGQIMGRILLPTKLDTKSDVNIQKKVASCIQRFLGSKKHSLFQNVLGLTEFGLNSSWKFDRLLPVSAGLIVPSIDFTLPYKFDLYRLKQLRPDVDYDGNLDADLIGWVEQYRIKFLDDNNVVIFEETILSETGKTNP